MEHLQKRLNAALDDYWERLDAVGSLDPNSSFDVELLGSVFRANLDASAYLVACAADDLLAELAAV